MDIKEQNLLNKFKKYWNPKEIYINNVQSNSMDCELIDDLEYIKLDANVFDNSVKDNERFSALFGNIIKGKNLEKAIQGKSSFKECYGILISENDLNNIKTPLEQVDKLQWYTFGKTFNAKYVYIFNEEKLQHKRQNWEDFYGSLLE